MTILPSFDLALFTPYLLNRAAEASSLAFQAHYRERYGMLRTEWRVLFHLWRYGSLTARAICDRAGLHKTKVSRAVAALESKRFLTRARSPSDRRREVLSLTRTGIAACEELNRAAGAYDAELLARFTDEERAVFQKCLIRLVGGDAVEPSRRDVSHAAPNAYRTHTHERREP